MGLVRRGDAVVVGPPKDLIAQLREAYDIPLFVETGTYEGDTALWASSVFPRVITIERSAAQHERAVRRLAAASNVVCMLGDSRTQLAEIAAGLDGPAVFWLDAHWSGGETYGSGDECPLLGELAALAAARAPRFVFIDDARLFLSPPPAPHEPESWPQIGEVVDAVRRLGDQYVVVFEDVIVAVPQAARDLVVHAVRDEDGANRVAVGRRLQRRRRPRR
jgi:hypothetical protein